MLFKHLENDELLKDKIIKVRIKKKQCYEYLKSCQYKLFAFIGKQNILNFGYNDWCNFVNENDNSESKSVEENIIKLIN